MVKVACSFCGKLFEVSLYRKQHTVHHFCSDACYRAWKSERFSGEKNPNWQGKTVRIRCDFCGKEIERPKSRVKAHNFCSRECKHKYQIGKNSGENSPYWKPRVKVTCDECGKEFMRLESQISEHNFCSRECMGKYRSRVMRGANNPLWKGRKVITCEQCGREFEIKPSQIKYATHHFCSRECRDKWQAEHVRGENHPQWNSIKAVCSYCGKEILRQPHEVALYKNLFCSRKCQALWQSKNKKGEKSNNWQGGKIKLKCDWCGREIEKHKSLIKEYNFCSRSCLSKWVHKHGLTRGQKSKPEAIFENISIKNDISAQYTGNGGFWIGKKGEKQLNPDFIIKVNGEKYVVEINGDYWHSPLLNRNLREDATLTYRKKFYKKHGWHPIFIWESDLKRKDAETFVLNLLRKEGVIE